MELSGKISRFLDVGVKVISLIFILSSCGGGSGGSGDNAGSGGSGNSGSTVNLLSLTIEGLVTDDPIPNANVTITIDDQSFTTQADENGEYSVDVSIDDSYADSIVKATATGSEADSIIKLVSYLGTLASIIEVAGDDETLTTEELFFTNITNVSTATAVALELAADGEITTDESFQNSQASIDTSAVMSNATAIKLALDYSDGNPDLILPDIVADTYEFVVEQDVITDYLSLIESNYAELYASVENDILTDTNLTPDTIAPVISLTGEAIIYLSVGATYTEGGASATDNKDGTLPVSISSSVDASAPGEYAVTYTATDSSGNSTSLIRTVIIADVIDVTASHTTEAGYTVRYRYISSSSWDSEQPRGMYVYLHGNISSSSDSLSYFNEELQEYLLEQGYIYVKLESPWVSETGARIWVDPEYPGGDSGLDMLSSVLTSGFGGTFTVDINDILLEGSSGGACFQNHFIQKYYNDFKGAAYIDCGCSQLPDDSTIAPLIDTESWRFYVLNNTEDFLYESGRSIYGYLKYTLGYEATIGDFDKIGGHCASTDEDRFEAFNWLLSDEPAPDVDFEPHFKPIEHFNDLGAIAIDDNENIWVVEEIENQVVNLHRGNNLGSEWSVVKTFTLTDSQIIKDLLYFDNYLYFDIDDEYLIKIDLSDFSEEQVLLPTLDLGDKRFYKNTLTTDHQDTLYYRLVNVDVASTSYSNNAWRSTDAGETWEYIDQIDSDVLIYVPELLRPTLNDVLSDYYLNYGNIAFDGENAWLVLNSYDADYFASMRLYKSTDLGSTWVDVTPVEFNQDDGESWYNSYTPEKIKYLLDGSLLITKGSHSWMSTDKGQSWVRVYGSSTDFSVFLEDVMSAESSDGKHTIIGFTEHEGLMYLEKTAP